MEMKIIECLKRNCLYTSHEIKNDKHIVVKLNYKGEKAVVSVFFSNDGRITFTPQSPNLPLGLSVCNALYAYFNQSRKRRADYLYPPKVNITLT